MKKYIRFAGFILVAVLTISGCSTINRLDEWDLTDSEIVLDMKAPPEPTVNIDFNMGHYDQGEEIFAFIQLGTNILKADGARRAEEKLYSALDGMYLPEFIAELTYDRLIYTLDASAVEKIRDADVILEVDIEEYGIESWSGNGHLAMIIEMQVRLFHKDDREIIWQRCVSVEEEITPGVFGFHDILGNAVTIAGLDSLTEEQLSEGFHKLTIEIMKEAIGLLQEDLRVARRR